MTWDRNEGKRKWRAVTFDYDRIKAQEQFSPKFFCLSETTRLLVLSVGELFRWKTRYDGDPQNFDLDKIEGWYETAMCELSGGQMIRQNPANKCQLQVSCDDLNWTTVMDFSACVGSSTPTEASVYDVELQDNITLYDSDISNLTDKWDYDGTYPDADTDTAMCWSARHYVNMVCDQQIVQINEKNEEVNFFQQLGIASGLMAATAGLMAGLGIFTLTAVTGGAGLALIAGILALAGAYDDEDPAIFADEDTRREIACEIADNLYGEKLTFARWQAALAQSGNVVKNFVDDTMGHEDLYMQYLFMTSGMVVAAATEDLDCNCEFYDREQETGQPLHEDINILQGTSMPDNITGYTIDVELALNVDVPISVIKFEYSGIGAPGAVTTLFTYLDSVETEHDGGTYSSGVHEIDIDETLADTIRVRGTRGAQWEMDMLGASGLIP